MGKNTVAIHIKTNDMMQLEIPALSHLHAGSSLGMLTEALDALPRQAIGSTPWPVYEQGPEVEFAVGHNEDCLFLKYYVKENDVQAKYRQTNEHVYKDSCVEFFIAFRGEKAYYNFEFNCLGTCRAGFGTGRDDRKQLQPSRIEHIQRWAVLKVSNKATPRVTWQLTLVIPREAFSEHRLTNLQEEQARVNFYKCGDDLPNPHYLAWGMIEAPEPNFHLPEFFGEAKFS